MPPSSEVGANIAAMLATGRLFVGPILADAISVASSETSLKVNEKLGRNYPKLQKNVYKIRRDKSLGSILWGLLKDENIW